MNQLYVYIYLLCFGFTAYLGHHRALSRVPGAVEEVLIITYFMYSVIVCIWGASLVAQTVKRLPAMRETRVQFLVCICHSPILPLHPVPAFTPWYPLHLFSASVYLCFVNKIIYPIFSDFTRMC